MNNHTNFLENIINSAAYPIIVFNCKGAIQLYNLSAEKFFHHTSEDMIGQNIETIISIEKSQNFKAFLKSASAMTASIDIVAIKKNCEETAIQVIISKTKHNNKKHFIAILQHLENHEYNTSKNNKIIPNQANKEIFLANDATNNSYSIDYMANSDYLTKLYNRSCFEKRFVDLLDKSQKNTTKFSLLLINLDNFKMVNNLYGNLAGDLLLENFAKLINASVKKTDIVARVSGDEFIVLLQNITNYQQAKKVALRIIELSRKQYKISNVMIKCSASIGIVGYPKSGGSKEQLMKRLNFALYHAREKESRVAFFSEILEQKYIRQRILEQEIEKGFDSKQFYCVFQPQVLIDTQKIIGFEVLIRWRHPTLGEILPVEFVPIIERLGKSLTLNIFVITEILSKVPQIQTNYPLKISINISPQVRNFSEHIKDVLLLLKTSRSNSNIKYCLELTESFLQDEDFNNLNNLTETFSLLESHNVDFAIDDFGIEHSSISRLISYKFTILKIDQLFIKKLSSKDKSSSKAVIKAIMSLSHDLGFDVISEGVENEAQIKILATLGCKIAQGFYYYKPLDFDDLLIVLNAQKNLNKN